MNNVLPAHTASENLLPIVKKILFKKRKAGIAFDAQSQPVSRIARPS